MVHWLYTLAICCWWCSCSHRALLLWLHGSFFYAISLCLYLLFIYSSTKINGSQPDAFWFCHGDLIIVFSFILLHLFFVCFIYSILRFTNSEVNGRVCACMGVCFVFIPFIRHFFFSLSLPHFVFAMLRMQVASSEQHSILTARPKTRGKKNYQHFWWEYISSLVRC